MVEWKKIDDIIISLKTGLNPRANFVLNTPESKIPYITGKDIFENRINVSDKTDMIDKKALRLINKRACLDDNLLLFASTGTGTVGRMAIVDKYNNDWGISETLYAIKTKDIISPYFLMYCLYSHNITKQFEPKISKGSVPHLKVVDLLNVQIPIPSLDEQNRIVGTLDKFTASIDNLKEQIAQRRKQYEYYRDQLLDLEGKAGGEMKKLGDIGDVCMCKRIMKEQTSEKGEIPFFKIGTFGYQADAYISKELFEEYKSKYSYPRKGEILISASGTIGRSVVFDGGDAYFQDSNIVWIANDEKQVSNRYLYYFYQVAEWKTDGGTIKRLYNYNLKSTIIPLPPLSEQQRIVSILDTFEVSIQNLEAQLSQREKQYEYYRNKLLTFE